MQELDAMGISKTELALAEQYILFGPPCKYGKLALSDFRPTKDDLTKVETIDIDGILNSVKQRAFADGYREGENAMWRKMNQDEEYRRMIAETSKAVDLEMRAIAIKSREEEYTKWMNQLTEKEHELNRLERRLGIRVRTSAGDAVPGVRQDDGERQAEEPDHGVSAVGERGEDA